MAKAEQMASGNWRVKVFLGRDQNGKRMFASVTAETKREAERKAALYSPDTDKSLSGMTVEEACREYIELRQNVLSPWTITTYLRYTNKCFDSIKNIRVGILTVKIIQKWVNDFSNGHSPKTVSNTYGFLHDVLHVYNRDLQLDCIRLPEKIKTEITIPTGEQIRTAQDMTIDTEMKVAIALCAGLGLRRGEISAIRKKDIVGNQLHVCRAFAKAPDGQLVIKHPKTIAGDRWLELPDSILSLINSLQSEDNFPYLLTLTPDAITRRWERICEKTGFHFRFYDLRHYNASVMLALGIPDLYAMKRIGHSTPDMLKRVYQHIQDQKKQEVSDIMTSTMNTLFE